MRQEDVWIPFTEGQKKPTLRTLYEINHTIKHAEAIYKHYRWDQELDFLMVKAPEWTEPPHSAGHSALSLLSLRQKHVDMANFQVPIDDPDVCRLADAGSLTEDMPGIGDYPRLQCVLFHRLGCACAANVRSGEVRSCPYCYTDYAFTVVKAPGTSARALVFTSWKMVGNAEANSRYNTHKFWESHATPGFAPVRVAHPGFVYRKCEADAARTIGCIYKPDLKDMHGKLSGNVPWAPKASR
ncbi:hypothetical protein QBC34DRAFT_444230 [Podospora aff. communis PSN243]|uniref:Uncharacterized protein n=1 Tax=Podospora aff. communis PSN243 TaxID=3040156 RepID=A0AAV9FZ41_9PEZI|nr:hypothetical protein QBC34DRAFT_444230 [Podospora aff. communis PSN243]